MTTLAATLAQRTDRCALGFALVQHPSLCSCAGLALKERGQSIATAAHPDDRARVEAAVRELAASGRPFSANDARAIHGVKGGVVGATFTALRKEGVIAPCGDETSSDPGTHGHRIFLWIGAA